MKLVKRAEWGARRPIRKVAQNLKERSTGHWNGLQVRVRGQVTWDHSVCASLVRGVQNFHMDGRGWSDIAYNFVICPHGYVYEGRGINVANGANGTNVGNRTSHAVMWLSGEGNPFTEEERVAFRQCVTYISTLSEAPDDESIGHRDHKPTECPGDERYSWIRRGMPLAGPIPAPEPPNNSNDEEDEMKTWFVRGPKGDVYVFDGVVLRPANNEAYRAILKMYGTEGNPWQNWSQSQIDAVPKAPGN